MKKTSQFPNRPCPNY